MAACVVVILIFFTIVLLLFKFTNERNTNHQGRRCGFRAPWTSYWLKNHIRIALGMILTSPTFRHTCKLYTYTHTSNNFFFNILLPSSSITNAEHSIELLMGTEYLMFWTVRCWVLTTNILWQIIIIRVCNRLLCHQGPTLQSWTFT